MRLIGNIVIFIFVVGTMYLLWDDIRPTAIKVAHKTETVLNQVAPELPTGKLFSKLEQNSNTTTNTDSQNTSTALTPITTAPVKTVKPVPATTNVQTPGPLPPEQQTEVNINGPITIESVIVATNKERVNAGLSPLTESVLLDQSALMKVNDMLSRQYFDHVSPTGVTLDQVVAKVGYTYITIGENLAYGNFSSANDVVTAWMNSPGHRANILNKNYTEIGIGARVGMFKGREVWMITQHFGLPSNACPTIDPKLKLEVDAKTAQADALKDQITAKKQQIDSTSTYTYEHEQYVQEYNQMVNDYNNLIADLKAKITEYNAEVNSYNSCVVAHTGASHE